MPTRTGPPTVAGRWSLLPARETDTTRRAHALAETLLDRHGVVTRGAVMAERAPGGFAAVYRVLAAFEETGRCRRGYFVEGLGAAQFALPGAVDRLRAMASAAERDDRPQAGTRAVVLAATDPANPYGAALPWPGPRRGQPGTSPAARPARWSCSSTASWCSTSSAAAARCSPGPTSPTCCSRRSTRSPSPYAKVTSASSPSSGPTAPASSTPPLGAALESAGFHATPRGLRLRS